MLTDLLGYYKRNVRKMKPYQLKKELEQIKQIEKLFNDQLKGVS